MDAVVRQNHSGKPAFGTGTSIVCKELMDEVGAYFPQGHHGSWTKGKLKNAHEVV